VLLGNAAGIDERIQRLEARELRPVRPILVALLGNVEGCGGDADSLEISLQGRQDLGNR
jgi:hypothetical protein